MISKFFINKAFLSRLSVLLIIVFFSFSLLGCEADDEIVQSGVVVSDDIKPYSDSTNERAANIIYSLLEDICTNNGIPSLTAATKAELRDISEDVRKLTVNTLLSEKRYNAVLDVLEQKRSSVVDALSIAFGGESVSLSEIESLYVEISEHTGSDYVGALLYNLCSYSYDYNFKKAMQRYEKYGYPHLLVEANKNEDRKSALVDGIGEENFVVATKLGFMLTDVFFDDGFENERIESFSDREMLLFLKYVSISSISVNADGWRLLSSYFIPAKSVSHDSYRNMLMYSADKNGDLDEFSAVCSEFIHLLSSVQNNLDDADIKALRSGDFSTFLTLSFSKFTDREWETVLKLSEIPYEVAEYESICEQFYGDNFKEYSSEIKTVTIGELRESVGSDNFIQKLEGYVAGISPAFSYWLRA